MLADPKPCPTCGAADRYNDGHCRPCTQKRVRAERAANPGVAAAKRRVWAAENPERELANQRAWRAANPGYQHVRRLQQYGLTTAAYDALLIEQSGRCDICAEPMIESCVIDHCHSTKKVRGLLCRPCNLGIGNLDDRLDRARAAVAYLERHA